MPRFIKCTCNICLNNLLHSEMHVMHCGHTYCQTCTTKTINQRHPTCPQCRDPLSKIPGKDGTRLHLDIASSDAESSDVEVIEETPPAKRFKRRVDAMDVGTTAREAKKLSRNLERFARRLDPGEGAEIWQSVKLFKERLIPVLDEIEKVKASNAELEKNCQEAQAARAEAETKLGRSNNEIHKLRKEKKAFDTDIDKAKEEDKQLRKRLATVEAKEAAALKEAQELCKENAKSKELLLEYKNSEHVQSGKVKGLKQENRRLQAQVRALEARGGQSAPLQDEDDLVVLPPSQDSEATLEVDGYEASSSALPSSDGTLDFAIEDFEERASTPYLAPKKRKLEELTNQRMHTQAQRAPNVTSDLAQKFAQGWKGSAIQLGGRRR